MYSLPPDLAAALLLVSVHCGGVCVLLCVCVCVCVCAQVALHIVCVREREIRERECHSLRRVLPALIAHACVCVYTWAILTYTHTYIHPYIHTYIHE